jgi:hypothetical protein
LAWPVAVLVILPLSLLAWAAVAIVPVRFARMIGDAAPGLFRHHSDAAWRQRLSDHKTSFAANWLWAYKVRPVAMSGGDSEQAAALQRMKRRPSE